MAFSYCIKYIHLDDCQLGSQGAMGIADATNRNKNIRVISLRNNGIDDDGAKAFGDLIFKYSSINLEDLNLSFNRIGDLGGIKLAQGLSKSKSLKRLNMKHNNMSAKSGKEFITALEENKILSFLCLDDNFPERKP